MHKTIIRFLSFIFMLIFMSCQDGDVERAEVISEASVSFNIVNQEAKTGSIGEDAFRPQLVIPLKQEDELKIVGYARINVFALDILNNESLNVQLYQIMEVENEVHNLDSLFLHHIKANEARFIEDIMEYRGFGIVMEYIDSEQTHWFSSNPLGESLDVDQTGSMIDIYEEVEQEGEVFFKANFNCKVFNDTGDHLTIESGELIYEL